MSSSIKTPVSLGVLGATWASQAAEAALRASESSPLAEMALRASESSPLAASVEAIAEIQKELDRMPMGLLAEAGTIKGLLGDALPTIGISDFLPTIDVSSQLRGLVQPLAMQAMEPLMSDLGSKLAASIQPVVEPVAVQAAKHSIEMAEEMAESFRAPLGASVLAETSIASQLAESALMESSIASQLEEAGLAGSSSLMTKGLLPQFDEHYLTLADGIGITAGLHDFSSWVTSIQPPVIEALTVPEVKILPKSLQEQFEKSQHLFEAVDGVARAWEGNALWFVLSSLNVGDLYLLADLSPEEVEEVILDALEEVILEGRFTRSLRATLAEAPHITHFQRENLLHGLQHAEDGEFLHAVAPIMYGLEGAIVSAARDRSVIDAERRLLSRPSKKLKSVEAIVKEMQLDEEFRRFLHRRVFGTVGDPFRHGDATEGERRQTLLAIVALSGWVDVFMGKAARAVLVDLMSERLPALVKGLSRQIPQDV